eukprot:scaffold237949_cov54-Attheya_sp.AAC.4
MCDEVSHDSFSPVSDQNDIIGLWNLSLESTITFVAKDSKSILITQGQFVCFGTKSNARLHCRLAERLRVAAVVGAVRHGSSQEPALACSASMKECKAWL